MVTSLFQNKSVLNILETDTADNLSYVIIFVIATMTIGVVGNVQTLLVYGNYYKKNNLRNYVLTISTVDLFCCCVTMPMDLNYLLHSISTPNVVFCKTFNSFPALVFLCSFAMFALIAVDRAKRVTTPLGRQITYTHSKRLCMACCIYGIIFTIPNAILNTYIETDLFYKPMNITLHAGDCGIQMKLPIYEKMNQIYAKVCAVLSGCSVLTSVISYSIMIGYLCVYSRNLERRATISTNSTPTSPTAVRTTKSTLSSTRISRVEATTGIQSETQHAHVGSNRCASISAVQCFTNKHIANTEIPRGIQDVHLNGCISTTDVQCLTSKHIAKTAIPQETEGVRSNSCTSTSTVQGITRKHMKGVRASIVFLIVTLVSFLFLLPSLILYNMCTHDCTFFSNMSDGLTKLLWRLQNVNNCINPIVYFIIDGRFRKNCKLLYRDCYRRLFKSVPLVYNGRTNV